MHEDRHRIEAVDGLRGWAVALVFAVHFTGLFAIYHRNTNLPNVRDFFALGAADKLLYWLFYSHYGVYVFFAISGFVISRSFGDTRTFSGYFTFLGHRLLRIYPAFLIAFFAAVLVFLYQAGGQAIALNTLLKNLVFLNGAFALDILGYNGVTWSLFFEFVFYLVFPLLFLLATRADNPRRMAPLLWLLGILISAVLSYGEWFLFLPFLAGACAGLQPRARLERMATRFPDVWLVGAYLATTTLACLLLPLPRRIVGGGMLWSPSMPVFVLCLGIVATLIIVRASYARGFLHRFLTSKPLLALGRISFSFFLLHTVVLSVALPMTEPYFNGTFGKRRSAGGGDVRVDLGTRGRPLRVRREALLRFPEPYGARHRPASP